MADVILFHHVLGPTPGVHAFADGLRAAGHRVSVPDLLEGARFDTIEAGVAHAEAVGFDTIIARGVAAASELPASSVYAGFSLGALPAQKLAQTRPGALAALLYHSAVPPETFGGPWPDRVALQIHFNDNDPWAGEDREAAEALASSGAELFIYPGSTHLFTDESLPDHDPASAALVLDRTLRLLARWP
jgi:dienelactone hydrolase